MNDAVDAYLASAAEPQRTRLLAMRELLGSLLPQASETIAYGAPAWTVDGTAVAGLSASARHWSYLPHSGSVTASLADALSAYEVSKGAIKVPADAMLPKTLVRKLIAARLSEISMVPDAKGVTRDFHPDGGLKATGRMKDGELHGDWRWWRRDGSLLRSGSFDRGRQVGQWTTYDREGRAAKVTVAGR